MKSHSKVEIQQNSLEWEAWRANKLGASEIPALMGESSYQKKARLLELKKTGEKEVFSSFTLGLFKQGHIYEEMMLPIISMQYELDFEKACFEDNRTGFLSASYDGLDESENIGWECKNSKKEMEYIKESGKPSPNYYGQVQAQIYVKDLEGVLFTAGTSASEHHTIEVDPDPDYIKRFLSEAVKFRKDWLDEQTAPLNLGPLVYKAMRIKRLLSKLKKEEKKVVDEIKSINWSQNLQFKNASYVIGQTTKNTLEVNQLEEKFGFKKEDYTTTTKSSTITIKELKKKP